MRLAWTLLAAAGLCTACASVLGIPNDTPSFCARPENQGHAYCEDFDVGDPSSRWSLEEATGNATYAILSSDRSPPNLIDFNAPAAPEGGTALVGFDKEFDGTTFVGLHIEADVRFVTADAGLPSNGGFLLITDKSGGCVGIAVQSGVIGALVFSKPGACSLTGGDPASVVMGPANKLTDAPPANQWVHLVVIVTPSPTGPTGSGTLTLDFVGLPVGSTPLSLPADTLDPTGVPLVGFAAQVIGPSAGFEVQYDNITIDLNGS